MEPPKLVPLAPGLDIHRYLHPGTENQGINVMVFEKANMRCLPRGDGEKSSLKPSERRIGEMRTRRQTAQVPQSGLASI
jgi:hypothetical protein